jgi:hypothetical protein
MTTTWEEHFDACVEGRVKAIKRFEATHGRLPGNELELARFVGDDFAVSMLTTTSSDFNSGDPVQDQVDSSSCIQWCKTERKMFEVAVLQCRPRR